MQQIYFNLIRVGIREIVRDKKLFFFILIFPLMFLAMFVSLGKMLKMPSQMTIHFDEFMFPGILIFALLGIGLYGTTSPLVDYRKNNTFKILETTTISKPIFILSQLSVRLIIGICQISLYLIIGAFLGYVNLSNLISTLLVSSLILIIMIMIGIFFGGIFNSSDLAIGLLAGLSGPILMLSNVMLPLDIFPMNFKYIAQIFPFAYMGDLLRSALYDNYVNEYSYLKSMSIILISILVLIFITIKTFKFYEKN
nr:ABC transporter permease [Mammaliicoccus sp. Marseille-Q6498]